MKSMSETNELVFNIRKILEHEQMIIDTLYEKSKEKDIVEIVKMVNKHIKDGSDLLKLLLDNEKDT